MSLPPEILELIISDIRDPCEFHDRPSLAACCRVSHLLRDISMKYLYQLFCVDMMTQRSTSSLELTRIAPSVAGWKGILHYSTEVHLYLNTRCYLCQRSQNAGMPKSASSVPSLCATHLIPVFDAIRRTAPSLCTLSWSIQSGILVSDELKESFYTLVQLPTITSLEIGGASPGALEDVLNATKIRKLVLMQHRRSNDSDFSPSSSVSATTHGCRGSLPCLEELEIHYDYNQSDILWPMPALQRLQKLSAYNAGAYSLECIIKLFPIMANSLTSLTLSLNRFLMREVSGVVLGLASLVHLQHLSLHLDEEIDGCETTLEAHQQMEGIITFLELGLSSNASLENFDLAIGFMIYNNSFDVFATWFRSGDRWKRLAKKIPVTLFKALTSFSFDITVSYFNDYEHKEELKKITSAAIVEVFDETIQILGQGFQTTVRV